MKSLIKKRFRLFISLGVLPVYLMAMPHAYALSINASIDASQITTNHSFNYVVTTDESLPEDAIDIRPLFRAFIIGNLQITHPTANSTEWKIPLQPVSGGSQSIPSIPVAGMMTTPININVLEMGDGTGTMQVSETPTSTVQNQETETLSQEPEHVIESSINKTTFYPNEPLILDVTVAKRADPENKPPQVNSTESMRIEPIGTPEQDSSIFGDRYQETVTYHYYLTSSQSGEVEIPAASLQSDPSKQSEPIHAFAKTIPSSHQDAWLPSAGISVEEKWDPQISYVKANQLLTRTIKITGINNTPEQLPDLPLPTIENVQVYLDTQSSNLSFQNGMLISTKTIRQVFVPQSGNAFTTPVASFKWWNTISDRGQLTELAARKFQAALTKTETKAAPTPEPIQTFKSKVQSLIQQHLTKELIYGLGGLLILAILILSYYFKNRHQLRARKALAIRWKAFQKLCVENNDPLATYQALMVWANDKWQQEFTTLEQLPFYGNVYTELVLLETACFKDATTHWNGKRLMQKIAAFKIAKPKAAKPANPEDLFHC